MKKAMFILSTVLLFGILSSCSKDEVALDNTIKKNWTFTITPQVSIAGVTAEIDPSAVETINVDNLTEFAAEAKRVELEKANPSESQTTAGITMTVKYIVTKKVRS